jgi:hypothetical protein
MEANKQDSINPETDPSLIPGAICNWCCELSATVRASAQFGDNACDRCVMLDHEKSGDKELDENGKLVCPFRSEGCPCTWSPRKPIITPVLQVVGLIDSVIDDLMTSRRLLEGEIEDGNSDPQVEMFLNDIRRALAVLAGLGL